MQQPDALMGLLPLAILILLFWLFARAKKGGGRGSGPTLVLKTFNIFKEEKNGTYIEIIGRPAGVISWLLTALRLETTTTLMLMTDRLEYRGASFKGENHTILPLPSIESTSCGYNKPVGWVIFGIIAIIFGLVLDKPGFGGEEAIKGVAIVVGALFIINYIFSKKMYITVVSGQTEVSISFKKSVIENVPVTLKTALEAISLLNNVIVASQMNN